MTQEEGKEGGDSEVAQAEDKKKEAEGVEELEIEDALSLEEVVASLSAETIAELTMQVEEAWKEHKHSMPPFLRHSLSLSVPDVFAQKHFLDSASKLLMSGKPKSSVNGKKRDLQDQGRSSSSDARPEKAQKSSTVSVASNFAATAASTLSLEAAAAPKAQKEVVPGGQVK